MKRQVTITYTWWRGDDNGKKQPVLQKHQEALEEHATDRINDQMKQGFTSGELHDNVSMNDDDGDGGVEYNGFWSVTTKTL